MHRQGSDAHRGRNIETVDAQGGEEHERQEMDCASRRLGGRLGLDFSAVAGEENGLRRRLCPQQERVYVRKRRSSTAARARVEKTRNVFHYFARVADSGFGSVLGWVFRSVLWGNVR